MQVLASIFRCMPLKSVSSVKKSHCFVWKLYIFFNSEMKFECRHVICSFSILYDLKIWSMFFFCSFYFITCDFSFLIDLLPPPIFVSIHPSLSEILLFCTPIFYFHLSNSSFPWGQMETRCLLFGHIFKFSNLAWTFINKSLSCWTAKSHHLFLKYYFWGLFLQAFAFMIL